MYNHSSAIKVKKYFADSQVGDIFCNLKIQTRELSVFDK